MDKIITDEDEFDNSIITTIDCTTARALFAKKMTEAELVLAIEHSRVCKDCRDYFLQNNPASL